MLKNYLFILTISLLILHEMDAIRRKEWKLFVGLKDLPEERGYLVFSILHLPLCFIILYFIMNSDNEYYYLFTLVVNIFLIFHGGIHLLFRKKKDNEFAGTYSYVIIFLMSVLGAIQLAL
ncbi:MAG TPA: hypothetical protein PLM53_16820 [Spirochaetota bacterium]|nr:hypothetical protein [Spirochaetota bacterium]HPC39871.1 hypothetical protein [Spirochaetota bacterium]HPL17801.1 hypothetical protein [Spirochaetota bacterium]HQF08953.1 hypothetical protein [Spirochaetota bacterium]HQH98761.1 hypothetical protein [Spirochaetota bacterium]